jgi:fumarate reductase subunit D
MAKSNEPIWWSLFAAGGMVAALFLPITVILTGIAIPAGWISEQGLLSLLHHPLTRLYLFVIIFLSLFHGGHRTLLTLVDLGFRSIRPALAVLFYGGAIVGTVLAAVFLIRL